MNCRPVRRLQPRAATAISDATQVVPVVLLKRESVVTDALRYCDDVGAGLLAMGSQALASPGTMTGSVALSMTREATRPLLIVKANAKIADIAAGDTKLRCAVAVDHNSRPCLKYVCSCVLQAARGDRIYLVRGKALDSGAQESVTSRRLLDAFADIAGDMRFRGPGCVKRPMEGALEADAVHLCEVEKIHVVAVQVPEGRVVPPAAMTLLKATRSAMLLFKSNQSF